MHLINTSGFALFTVSWWRGIAFISGVRALRFKSWSGQSNTVLPMARHHCNISSKGVVLLRRSDVEMQCAFLASYRSKYNSKARITRSSFLYNLFALIILELSHLGVIFLKNFLPDGSIWNYENQN